MKFQQASLINIASIVDYCCETRMYTTLSDEEILQEIAKNSEIWKLVEKKFKGRNLEKKKHEILYVLAIRFGIQFSQNDRNFLSKNPLCTFEDMRSTVDRIRSEQHQLK